MSIKDKENMVDLDKIAAMYSSFPYITAEVEIAGFYASSPHSMNHTLEMRLEYVLISKPTQKFEKDSTWVVYGEHFTIH